MTPSSLVLIVYYNYFDLHFARAMMRLCRPAEQSRLGELLCRLLSYQIRQGHVCLDLDALPPLELWPLYKTKGQQQEPEQERALLLSKECREWLNSAPIVSSDPEHKICPLVWKKPRLYLYRYYNYEAELLRALVDFGRRQMALEGREGLRRHLDDCFPQDGDSAGLDRQKLAALLSLTRPFLIISGGPGTGKTSTVARLLRLHQKLRSGLRIALTAPTGKAARRMQEALHSQKSGSELSQVLTLQRLLGQSRDGRSFRYNKSNPLSVDLLIIDEASMLPLALFVRTLWALSPGAQLILLGDHHQLASVETGAVLGELCRFRSEALSPALSKKLKPFLGAGLRDLRGSQSDILQDSIVVLEKNFRFKEKSGIAVLSGCIRKGDIKAALACLQDKSHADIYYKEADMFSEAFQEVLLQNFAPCFSEPEPRSILKNMQAFCVLAPFWEGRQGVKALNAYIFSLLVHKNFLPLYSGRPAFYPILITRNDHQLQLFNGDFGLAYQTAERQMACFFTYSQTDQQKHFRELLGESLPGHETAFAITVHKSQGSEFDHIALLLPEESHPLLTRELVYTALTRARKRLSLFASGKVLETALMNSTRRSSGLTTRLRDRS